ncbi:leucyl aminopeptidase family protein [Paracerasibacillus soli]|uniref:Probable cytosol aminopeptidase n=1 Tax=Paracerasibacillus soli TaxID=480284 RepID=A0ABU5CRT3_9BACI|nr:leucyl aminopeptidase family protein [Virgibacillus soli]MDY0409084.1 leucyl aminopeptidase family protein [Virgibacillus soli]
MKISIINFNNLEKEEQKQYVKKSSGDYVVTLLSDQLYVVLKEVSEKKQTAEKVRMVAGAIARDVSKREIKQAIVAVETLTETFPLVDKAVLITAFTEGWHLGTYSFATYKSKNPLSEKTELVMEDNHHVADFVAKGKLRAEATAFSRDLMNELSNVLNPQTFPDRLQEEYANTGIGVTVFDKAELEKREMHGLLKVGQGSKYDPSFVELAYCGDDTKPLVALVGKGVTFDTGGISLKGSRDLSSMRMDMGGAAAVAGAMKLLAESNAPVNVVALIPMAENIPDQESVLPGEVIQYKNGKTVQIGNTDAEGRLILADGLIRAGELGAEYVVDIATLTGAIANALGSRLGGVFGDEALQLEMKKIGDENGDFVWPMPLVDDYESYLNSDYADFSNISSKGEAGSITAALFLRHLVPESAKWLHVDMAGVMMSREKGYYGHSATGFGARLLADFTERVSK